MNWLEQNVNLWGCDIPWLSGLRDKGLVAFRKSGEPNKKTEAWKYSYVKSEKFGEPIIDTKPHECHCHNDGEECCCHKKTELPFDYYEIKFCNGKLAEEHLNFSADMEIKPLAEAIFDKDAQPYLNKSFEMENFPFAALNTAYVENGLMIVIKKNAKIDKPIYLNYHTHSEQNIWNNIRNIIILESGAKAEIIEHYEGKGSAKYFNNIVNEIWVGQEAQLHHYMWQKEAFEARHIALNSVIVKKDGFYKSFCANGECRLSRCESFIRLQAEGATTEANGVYRLKNGGVSDITTNVRHLCPHTYSNQLVKGVLDRNSKGVFQGQIHIAPEAQQTEGHQLHQAILLSDEAEVDCKPELEIFADDVKCSHGATSGNLDKEQLFYMQSRGIDLETARKILIDAYLNEPLEKIENEQIREWLKENMFGEKEY